MKRSWKTYWVLKPSAKSQAVTSTESADEAAAFEADGKGTALKQRKMILS